jgi:hypothetical protein
MAMLLEAFASDPKLAGIVADYQARQREPGKRFGSNGLKVNGKLFALFVRGKLVVKLPKSRVSALVASGAGKQFDPGHGRLMKEWLTISSPKASWVELAMEAHQFVKSSAARSSPR